MQSEGALVLFSGGQDSTTCLAWALERFGRVETVGFDYGQRHRVELECRSVLLDFFRARGGSWTSALAEDHLLSLGVLADLSETALTHDVEIGMCGPGLPNTFVPGRNILFLTIAAALAYRRGLRHLVAGVCETDYSGYPDCRDDAVKALQVALNAGMASQFVIHTPLMWLDKRQTWQLAEQVGGPALVEAIAESSHTCYRGERGRRHSWGYGCGTCPACEVRARGFRAYAGQRDQTPINVRAGAEEMVGLS